MGRRRGARRSNGSWPLVFGVVLLALAVLGSYSFRFLPATDSSPQPSGQRPGGRIASVPVDEFWVEPEAGPDPVLEQIASARESLDIVVYLMTTGKVMDRVISEIVDAHQRGVMVRVMVEENPFGGGGGDEAVEALDEAGVPWKYGNPTYRYTHEKAIVVDGERALVMTANLTNSAFTRNREYLALVSAAEEVAEIQALFDADWKRTRYVPHVPSLVVSDVNSREKLLALIESAEESLDIEAEVMSDREVRDALVAAQERGVRVRLVMSEPEPDETSYEAISELARAGVGVRLLNSPYIHAKSVLVDDRRAYVGSINFTANSMDQNRELGILTDTPEVLRKLGTTFASDWAEGEPFRPGE